MKTLPFKTLAVSFVLLIVSTGLSSAQEDSVGVANQSATPPQQPTPTPSQSPTLSMLNSIA